MTELPEGYVHYKTAGPFTQDNIPPGFLKEHSTKKGTWGQLVIESGELIYHVTEPGAESTQVLGPHNVGTVVSQQKHHVEVSGEVVFRIEFYRMPNTD